MSACSACPTSQLPSSQPSCPPCGEDQVCLYSSPDGCGSCSLVASCVDRNDVDGPLINDPTSDASATGAAARRSGSSVPAGAIAGAVVGGVLFVLILIGAVVLFAKRRRRRRRLRHLPRRSPDLPQPPVRELEASARSNRPPIDWDEWRSQHQEGPVRSVE